MKEKILSPLLDLSKILMSHSIEIAKAKNEILTQIKSMTDEKSISQLNLKIKRLEILKSRIDENSIKIDSYVNLISNIS